MKMFLVLVLYVCVTYYDWTLFFRLNAMQIYGNYF